MKYAAGLALVVIGIAAFAAGFTDEPKIFLRGFLCALGIVVIGVAYCVAFQIQWEKS